MRTPKAVPVVLRRAPQGVEILVFTHPLAGVQIVKGTVEAGESVNEAAVRELAEESGIKNSQCARDLGTWEECAMGQVWHFREMMVEQELPDDWTYSTQDGGGHLFTFAWYPLHGGPPSDCQLQSQFCVAPERKGKGLGARLNQHATEVVRLSGASLMALDTALPALALIGLYERWGYRVVDRCDWRPDTNYESVVMAKDLTEAGCVA